MVPDVEEKDADTWLWSIFAPGSHEERHGVSGEGGGAGGMCSGVGTLEMETSVGDPPWVGRRGAACEGGRGSGTPGTPEWRSGGAEARGMGRARVEG